MKLRYFIAAVVYIFLLTAVAGAQGSLTLDHVENLVGLDTIATNTTITFHLRFNNTTGANVIGSTNGFKVYSPDGATWTPITYAPYYDMGTYQWVCPYENWPLIYNGSIKVNPMGITGSGIDTIGFAGYSDPGGYPPSDGVPIGFDEITYTITTGVDDTQHGKTLCLDSCYYPTMGVWLWSTDTGVYGEVIPVWDGPHCYIIIDFCVDSDGDGFGDPGYPANTCPDDNCPDDYNPSQDDIDSDGIGDACDECTDTDADGFGNPGFPANTCPEDNCPDIYNPDQNDIDGDGLGDDCDDCTDFDNDGYGDPGYLENVCPDDNCPAVYNPDQEDLDGDGIGDACDECTDTDADGFGNPGFSANTCPDDNCPNTYNPGQEDIDNDGLGDDCDNCTDFDNDGYGDPGYPANVCPEDNCPDVYNPNQKDIDSDGYGNLCDNCPDDYNPSQTDTDLDNIGDDCDNCQNDYNPNQKDTDNDGIGDVCDDCTDTDGDGFGDPGHPANTCPEDNCPYIYNPDQEDFDSDGFGDDCDNCPYISNIPQYDADHDGIGNACDECTDTDRDGYGNPGFPANTCPDDNCPNNYNPGQEDSDMDGFGDVCDVSYDLNISFSTIVHNIAVADLDLDNNTDAVFSGIYNDVEGVYVMYGNEYDDLDAPELILEIGHAVIILDYLDNDNLIDIIAVTSTSIYTLLNDESKGFNPKMGLADNGEYPSAATGLFDDDQYLDLITTTNSLFFGDGSGDYSSPVTLPFSFEYVTASDFNNDGFDDILIIASDSAKIYCNDGTGSFNKTSSVYVFSSLNPLPQASVISDFDFDHNPDYAVLIPAINESGESMITYALGNGNGDVSSTDTIRVFGEALSIKIGDVNRDQYNDIIVINSATRNFEFYYGDGNGNFSDANYKYIDIAESDDLTMASIDFDRDGNIDLVASGSTNDNTILAVNGNEDSPTLIDEMVITGYEGVQFYVINPENHIITREWQNVASSAYSRYDIDEDGNLDDQSYDYNLMYGEYKIVIEPREGGTAATSDKFSMEIRINGTQQLKVFQDHSTNTEVAKGYFPQQSEDSLVFYYEYESESSISPPNGGEVNANYPRFDWSVHASMKAPRAIEYEFQLDDVYDFDSPLYQVTGISSSSYQLPTTLIPEKIYYWRYRSYDGITWSDFSHKFAVFTLAGCCVDIRGNADGDTNESLNISDITYLVAYLFGGGPVPECIEEGNATGDTQEAINIADVCFLVSYCFGGGPQPPNCP